LTRKVGIRERYARFVAIMVYGNYVDSNLAVNVAVKRAHPKGRNGSEGRRGRCARVTASDNAKQRVHGPARLRAVENLWASRDHCRPRVRR